MIDFTLKGLYANGVHFYTFSLQRDTMKMNTIGIGIDRCMRLFCIFFSYATAFLLFGFVTIWLIVVRFLFWDGEVFHHSFIVPFVFCDLKNKQNWFLLTKKKVHQFCHIFDMILIHLCVCVGGGIIRIYREPLIWAYWIILHFIIFIFIFFIIFITIYMEKQVNRIQANREMFK